MRRVILSFFLTLGLVACADVEVDYVGPTDVDPPAAVDPPSDDVPPELDENGFPKDWIGGTCGPLFGLPGASTGLSDAQCQPSCNCDGRDFEEPIYTEEDFDVLRGRTLLTPPERLTYDPYEDKDQYDHTPTTVVCAFKNDEDDPNGYHLATYADDAEAAAAGAQITHYGPCGACSSFDDLVVYLAIPDLTNPVRRCGLDGMKAGKEKETVQRACLEDLGFTDACVDIWYFNTEHTKAQCLSDCLLLLSAPLHTKDGKLNKCIQCDENLSGPVFKNFAGRTRRNSGLATALCRPCDEVSPIDHRYGE